RRRHTICLSDWSSDVCSSDLRLEIEPVARFDLQAAGRLDNASAYRSRSRRWPGDPHPGRSIDDDRWTGNVGDDVAGTSTTRPVRSEERRVGKEGTGGSARDEW